MSRRAAAALGLVLAVLGLTGTASARAAWGKPFQLSTPGSLDYLGPQLAFSDAGAAAATFAVGDVDRPGTSAAYLVARTAAGGVGRPRSIAGAQQILSLAYDGRQLELLVGTSPRNQDCCSTAAAVQVSPSGAVQRARTLVGGLTGAAQGQLLTLADGQMTAAVATERGVWVVQSSQGNRFGGQHLVSDKGQEPINMSAAWLGGESTIVAWTAGTGIIGATAPRSIYYATGSRKQAPHRAQVALTVASGHRIDELAVVRRGSGSTLAWIESWYDRKGAYHSRVEAADLGSKAPPRALSPDNRLASGLTFAGDAGGDQGLAWESCTVDGTCAVQAAGRPAKRSFRGARTLGAIDSSQTPALTISPQGQVIIGWVRGGHPVASAGFGSPSVLSATTYATATTVAYGPTHQALAAWTQGTLNPSVVAASYHAR
ncbi:MAG: hypothetical protein ACR2NR_19045 [Solirubrobacteraceae bacterium]